MAAIHDTAYPRLKFNLTKKEITKVYTPLDEEIVWAKSKRFKGQQLLLCLVGVLAGNHPNVREMAAAL